MMAFGRRALRGTVALAVAVTTLAACSNQASESGGGGEQAGGDQTLVVYTNSNSDGRGEWVTEKAAEAGFDIEIVGLGGADLTNRIIAEVNNPVGDVVYGLNTMFFEQLKAEQAITAHEPSWAGEVPQDAGDPVDGAYWPLVDQAILTVYDSATTTDAPTDVAQLWTDPAFAGRYEVNTSLGQATPQLVLAGLLAPYAGPDGEVSDEGWAAVQAYYANGSPAVEGTDLYARFERGEVAYGVTPSGGVIARDEQYGTETAVVPASAGVPFVTEQVGVIAGTDSEQRAKEFIDWLGSAEVQGEFATEFNSMPVNEVAAEQANPEVVELVGSVQRADIDYALVREHIGEWVERVELEYLP
ncbi:extracellular solute-binding protein [Auraticoccus monumenti]|uniref:Iron(III) transport system substrate-binding protein n=1 Tax=Auraticoccus monumenti TaxID=675864 RepID=A0A1G7DDP0_9ACTN|nr:extracellular solute-binding protein [Auraticoccus monumenti]SDE49096.1 iron(III) transport system substrate-binding protein [Auraticoccus monumenti]